MQTVDLSRFSACTIRRVKLVNLMQIPEFRARLDAYIGDVDDRWVYVTAQKVERQLRTPPALAKRILDQYGEYSLSCRKAKQSTCHKMVKYIRKYHPELVDEIGSDSVLTNSVKEIGCQNNTSQEEQ